MIHGTNLSDCQILYLNHQLETCKTTDFHHHGLEMFFYFLPCEKQPTLWCSLQLNVIWSAFGFYVKWKNSSRRWGIAVFPPKHRLYNKTCWTPPAIYLPDMCINLGLSHCDINKNKSLIHTQKAVQNVNLLGVTLSFPYPLHPLNSFQMFQTCQEVPCINMANHDQTDGGTIICWSLTDQLNQG